MAFLSKRRFRFKIAVHGDPGNVEGLEADVAFEVDATELSCSIRRTDRAAGGTGSLLSYAAGFIDAFADRATTS